MPPVFILSIFPSKDNKMFEVYCRMAARFLFFVASGAMIFVMGCFTSLAVAPSPPPAVDMRNDQPMAVLPPPDAAGFTGSGSLLLKINYELLKAKNFVVIPPEKGVHVLQEMAHPAQEVSRTPGLLRRFAESIGSPIVMVPIFLDYRPQKSYISSSTSQVWQGASYEYQSLPTYYQGFSEMKVCLKMFDSEKGEVVWTAEGKGRGPSGSEERILRHLVETLKKHLPLLPEKRE